MFFNLIKKLKKGRSFQPSFKYRKILKSFLVVFIAINILTLLIIHKDQSLLMSSFGAPKVFLFSVEESPLAQQRYLIKAIYLMLFQLFF